MLPAARRLPVLLALAGLLLGAAEAPERNGFALTDPRVPAEKIVPGGPPRDAIRSVDEPNFAPTAEARWARPDTPVLGVVVGGQARAYPVHLLERHQIVNDDVAGTPIAVTFDPLTGVPHAFDRRVAGKTLRFGVSGLIYNSGFLLFDRETESLWSQMTGDALAGAKAGQKLAILPIRQLPLGRFTALHPETRVLAPPIEAADYSVSPYELYWTQDRWEFPIEAFDRRFHAKELVLGVEVGETKRAYLGSLVTAAGGKIRDEIGGKEIELAYSTEDGSFEWKAPDGVEITEAYWFAWKAFHPDTEVWHDPGEVERAPEAEAALEAKAAPEAKAPAGKP